MALLRNNLANFVQFKQHQIGTTRYFFQSMVILVCITVNINSLGTNTVTTRVVP